KYWTIDEFNTSNLPVEKWYLVNRAIWLGVAFIFAGVLYSLFKFSEQGLTWRFGKKKKPERLTKSNLVGLHRIVLPKVTYDFSFKSRWNNVLNFTRLNFKALVKNRVFLILVV